MSQQEPIIQFYKKFLTDLGLECGEDGGVWAVLTDPKTGETTTEAVKISLTRDGDIYKLPLYLPLKEARETDDGTKVFFHPACEGLHRGQSEVLNATLMLVNQRVFSAFALTVESLLKAAANTEEHKTYNTYVMKKIRELPDVNATTLNGFRTMFKNCTRWSGPRPLLTVWLAKDGKIDGVPCMRTSGLTLHVLKSDNLYVDKPKGPGLSAASKAILKKAMEMVIGESPNFQPIVNGSNSPTAPYFTALAKTFHQAMVNIDEIARILGPLMMRDLNYDGGWHKSLGKLHDWYRNGSYYIQLNGNVGEVSKRGKHNEEDEAVVETTRTSTAPPRQQEQHRVDNTPPWEDPKPEASTPAVVHTEVAVKDTKGVSSFEIPQGIQLPPPLTNISQTPYVPQQFQQQQVYYDQFGQPVNMFPPQPVVQQPVYIQQGLPQQGFVQQGQPEMWWDSRMGVWKPKGTPAQPQQQVMRPPVQQQPQQLGQRRIIGIRIIDGAEVPIYG